MNWHARLVTLSVALVCIIIIALQVRHRQMRAGYLILWSLLGVVMAPLVILPSLLNRLSRLIGIYYPPAALFLAATIVLFLINVHFSREISRLDERTRVLAEELALLRLTSSPGIRPEDTGAAKAPGAKSGRTSPARRA